MPCAGSRANDRLVQLQNKFKEPTAAAGTAAQWVQRAKIRRKGIHLLLFHEFFKASFFIVSHSFGFRSHVLTLYQNFVKLLKTYLLSIISQFHDFFQSNSWPILAIWQKFAPPPPVAG